MSDPFSDVIHTSIWQEQAEAHNPFAAAVCRASGYDVFGDVIGKATYIEYLFLLFRGERPTPEQARALEILAIALANPGPRDPSVHAAMATGASGTPAATSLIAALAPGAGGHGGAREVFLAMELFSARGTDPADWEASLSMPTQVSRSGIWPASEHPPGFDAYCAVATTPVVQTLTLLASILPASALAWLARERITVEAWAGHGLAMTGVCASTLLALGFSADAGEMLSLLLRLPGAAVHALEQRRQGFRQFPFFELDLQNDPAKRQ